MGCPHCEEYADYQAGLEAEAQAQYEAEQAWYEYLQSLIKEEKYELYAFEYLISRMYRDLCKEDRKKISDMRDKIIEDKKEFDLEF